MRRGEGFRGTFLMKAGESRSGGGLEEVVPFLGRELRVWQVVWSERPFHSRVPLWSIFRSGDCPKGEGSSERRRCLLGNFQIGSGHCGVFFRVSV